jgi:glutathione S-transferase
VLAVHHLGKSQSERIVWLCEELELPYELKTYTRDSVTIFSPPELRAKHPIGAAPLLEDGDVLLAESAAIAEYILIKYGNGRLVAGTADPNFADYLYWFHFANGTLQPAIGRYRVARSLDPAAATPAMKNQQDRLGRAFGLVETRLGESPYLAGEAFTAADIMTVFSLTTMRYFQPIDLAPYPNIRAYLARIAGRPAYKHAMEKGDPGMKPLLD